MSPLLVKDYKAETAHKKKPKRIFDHSVLRLFEQAKFVFVSNYPRHTWVKNVNVEP